MQTSRRARGPLPETLPPLEALLWAPPASVQTKLFNGTFAGSCWDEDSMVSALVHGRPLGHHPDSLGHLLGQLSSAEQAGLHRDASWMPETCRWIQSAAQTRSAVRPAIPGSADISLPAANSTWTRSLGMRVWPVTTPSSHRESERGHAQWTGI